MLAHELHRHITTSLEGDVGHLLARSLLEHHGNDLVFLLGARTRHLDRVGRLALQGIEEFLG